MSDRINRELLRSVAITSYETQKRKATEADKEATDRFVRLLEYEAKQKRRRAKERVGR